MVTLSRVKVCGNPRFPYMGTLDRVTIYRKIIIIFFLTANLSKLGPLPTHPIGVNFGPVRRTLGIDHDGVF
jgi:hypothetical protein